MLDLQIGATFTIYITSVEVIEYAHTKGNNNITETEQQTVLKINDYLFVPGDSKFGRKIKLLLQRQQRKAIDNKKSKKAPEITSYRLKHGAKFKVNLELPSKIIDIYHRGNKVYDAENMLAEIEAKGQKTTKNLDLSDSFVLCNVVTSGYEFVKLTYYGDLNWK